MFQPPIYSELRAALTLLPSRPEWEQSNFDESEDHEVDEQRAMLLLRSTYDVFA